MNHLRSSWSEAASSPVKFGVRKDTERCSRKLQNWQGIASYCRWILTQNTLFKKRDVLYWPSRTPDLTKVKQQLQAAAVKTDFRQLLILITVLIVYPTIYETSTGCIILKLVIIHMLSDLRASQLNRSAGPLGNAAVCVISVSIFMSGALTTWITSPHTSTNLVMLSHSGTAVFMIVVCFCIFGQTNFSTRHVSSLDLSPYQLSQQTHADTHILPSHLCTLATICMFLWTHNVTLLLLILRNASLLRHPTGIFWLFTGQKTNNVTNIFLPKTSRTNQR